MQLKTNYDTWHWPTNDSATLVPSSGPWNCSLFSVSLFVSAKNPNLQTYHVENRNVNINAYCLILSDHFFSIPFQNCSSKKLILRFLRNICRFYFSTVLNILKLHAPIIVIAFTSVSTRKHCISVFYRFYFSRNNFFFFWFF